jgi:hypothetical protein
LARAFSLFSSIFLFCSSVNDGWLRLLVGAVEVLGGDEELRDWKNGSVEASAAL